MDAGGCWAVQEGGDGCLEGSDGGSGDGRKGLNVETVHQMEAKLPL